MKCPACADEVAEGKRFCSSCGADVQAHRPTLSRADAGPAVAVAPSRTPSDLGGAQPARFLPGMVIAERYRIVAQIGRGGMGEVYRADDLRLGQPVALKFLPEALTRDPGALARLNREVRTARQVSHPNVCRVFDIGEADKVPFITMEFVDGEDLASLLRRIGRLQPAKALQLAHQLCAGLAEIHAFGILHRDLKPANIMLDGRGNLRITDFGLAVVAQDIPGEEAHAGTPAYMAPEQLAGEKPTQQSDIYALGLILYELFTGKPAFEGLRARTQSTPKPSSIVKDVDPVIERAILRCLEKEPTARPRTASVVASAFPGGDPLAAAIAAGETPSPEMVAAAVDEPALSVGRAWLLLALFLVSLAGLAAASRYASVFGLAPPEKAPEVLADNARQIVKSLGYTAPPADSAYWVSADPSQLRYLIEHEDSRQWRRSLPETYPTLARLFYRESPALMETPLAEITQGEPPMTVPGMVQAEVDQQGRLVFLHVVPPLLEESRPTWPEPDWAALFAAAGLPQAQFSPVNPKHQPPMAFDNQAAWEGNFVDRSFHVSAATFHGRPVYFEVFAPWGGAPSLQQRPPAALAVLMISVLVGLWLGGLVLARRNWRQGRGDRNGALRLGTFVFVGFLVSGLIESHHVPTFVEYISLVFGTGVALHFGLFTAVLYLALEPLVRRRWPNYLVSWTRLLSGRFRNPRVGRDVLLGSSLGVAMMLLVYGTNALPYWFHLRAGLIGLHPGGAGPLPQFLGYLCLDPVGTVVFSVGTLAVLLLLVLIVRKTWIAFALLFVLSAVFQPAAGSLIVFLVTGVAQAALVLFLLTRYGLLALTAFWFVTLLSIVPLTADPSRWFFGRSALGLLIVTGVAVWGFRTALAGRPAFGGTALDE